MGKVVMGAEALDGYLTEDDVNNLHEMNELYTKAMNCFSILETEKGEKKQKPIRRL
ncbi:hypothetical protein [Treponema pedis]|uniref:hypothetical protein n=1 Tax=Treponema pedis TaxID=409322 RepID=UPI003EBD9B42